MRCSLIYIVVIVALALAACKKDAPPTPAAAAGAPPAMPAMPVAVADVAIQTVPTELHIIGTVEASAVVQIKSQVAGELTSVNFTEGQNVEKGDLLFRIDPRPFQDAVAQAEAAVERDKAQIAQAQASALRDDAQAKYAATDAALQAELHKGGLTSKSQFDQSASTLAAAKATAAATQATIDSARAAQRADEVAVQTAQLNLSYCEIRAPLSGRTGNLLVHPGNLVKVNDVPLVVVHRISPIFVDFSVPEQHLAAVRRLDAAHKLPVRVTSQDDPGRAATGSLSVIDNTVDAATGTIHLKATFENRDRILWPGQFVNVVLTLDTVQHAAVIPTVAIQAGQTGSFVFAVKPDHTVEIRPVTVGRSFGDKTVVDKGLAGGDRVVTDGQMILAPGMPVRIVAEPKLGS